MTDVEVLLFYILGGNGISHEAMRLELQEGKDKRVIPSNPVVLHSSRWSKICRLSYAEPNTSLSYYALIELTPKRHKKISTDEMERQIYRINNTIFILLGGPRKKRAVRREVILIGHTAFHPNSPEFVPY